MKQRFVVYDSLRYKSQVIDGMMYIIEVSLQLQYRSKSSSRCSIFHICRTLVVLHNYAKGEYYEFHKYMERELCTV